VAKTAREHEMFSPGDLVLVSVSGGPDSTCLLHALYRLRRLFKIDLAVFHFDHRLRPDSAKDAKYVAAQAKRLGLPFEQREAKGDFPGKQSTEMWARWERTRGMIDAVRATRATRVADGHTQDDQAETILMGLILGWGPEGMTGIAPVNGNLVRPMLDIARSDVEAFCRALHLRPRRDPTNEETTLLRNAIRLEAIPAIEQATGRQVKETFAQTAKLLREDSHELFLEATKIANELVSVEDAGFSIEASALLALPPALAGRVVRRGFQMAHLGWTHEAIAAVIDLARGRSGRRRHLPMSGEARMVEGKVRVRGIERGTPLL
jgi:tRNA(Ile)-lysidine synthase